MLVIRQKKKRFHIIQGKAEIESVVDKLPEAGECFKFLSDGGFSSICFVLFVAERATIKNLYISSFRIGTKEIQLMHQLHNSGRLQNCSFLVGTHMKDEKSPAFRTAEMICDNNGWDICTASNHSKVHLYDTDRGKFVLETSSNLNENPKMEQFSLEEDAELFDFYAQHIFGVGAK